MTKFPDALRGGRCGVIANIVCRILAITAPTAEALAPLAAGDSVLVIGAATMWRWAQRDGKSRAGLSVRAARVEVAGAGQAGAQDMRHDCRPYKARACFRHPPPRPGCVARVCGVLVRMRGCPRGKGTPQ